jgi:hypothetical protein
MAHGVLRAGIAAAVLLLPAWQALADAPQQLRNKTIQASWSVDQVARGADGVARPRSIAVSHTVYISSAGRVFERSSRANGRASAQSENAPGAAQNRSGEATGLRFVGNRLVGDTAFEQGARHWEVNFDAGFASCTVTVTFGREAGGIKRKGINGEMLTIEQMKATSENCSIRDGNPFASQ